MPHGTPDWGLVGPKTTTYGLDDLGEHAVRLGSPHLWDRRGDVIWFTTFAEGLGDVQRLMSGLNAGWGLHTGMSRQGAYAIRLTAGSDDERYCGFYKNLPYPHASRCGAECSFSVAVNTQDFRIEIRWLNGTRTWAGTIRYYHPTSRFQYESAAGVWTEIADVFPIPLGGPVINVMKVVIDPILNTYIRAILNGVEYSLIGIPLVDHGAVASEGLDAFFAHYGVALTNPFAYADCAIVTQNEP